SSRVSSPLPGPFPFRLLERSGLILPSFRRGRTERACEAVTGEARRGKMPTGRRRGPFWSLPVARSDALGKLGPGFGIGAGCGVGVGFGLVGGIGAGFPGLQLGFGAGAGCGIGIGFGYGFGKGVAYDESGRYSNIRRPFQSSRSPAYDEQFDIMFDELMESTRKLIKATSKEIDKWRRM
ncbi:unnamed protein product, partial [Urochloa humidicola]